MTGVIFNYLHLGLVGTYTSTQQSSQSRPTEAGLLVGMNRHSNRHTPKGSARCVQSFDDSLDFAIRMTYRISLRSSSLWEPRHPLLKVFSRFMISAGFHVSVRG
jgi:hypothetical protein